MYTQKITIVFDGSRAIAIMAVDHSRLGLENKFFPKKYPGAHLHHLFFCKFNWTAAKFNFML